MRIIVWLVTLVILLVVGTAFAQPTKPPDPWGPLQFLVGEWVSVPASGEGTGGSTFSFGLDKNILIRDNHAEVPTKPGEPYPGPHKDLMVISPVPGGQFKAQYWDNEGHTIAYTAKAPKPNAVVFTSDKSVGMVFQLTYELGTDGKLSCDFAFGQQDGSFKTYLKGTLKRVEKK